MWSQGLFWVAFNVALKHITHPSRSRWDHYQVGCNGCWDIREREIEPGRENEREKAGNGWERRKVSNVQSLVCV